MENMILCAASAYDEKYYFNKKFDSLPESVKEELHIMCVLFTAEVGGILVLRFDEDGRLQFQVKSYEEDLLFDEIGSVLKVKELQRKRAELLESLELYFNLAYE